MKNKYFVLSLLSLLAFIIGCTQYDPGKDLQPLVDKYVGYWNTGEFDGIENVLHPEFELRMTPKYEPEKGIELFKENVTNWRKAYPDFTIVIDEMFFSEEMAAAIWTITATNSGEGWHPPTGKTIKVTGMSIVHFSEGKIIDEWIASNNGYWMHQLGFKIVSPFEAIE
ncbi:MAG: ester cyclase [Ignavibacteriaceae bacterium]|jgi:predicted ester cyclase